ncbi:MAG: branched-chain amino acid transporter substrate-binding protein [Rhodospirillales bacterium]|nr:branched-chain amino acid transporter substrate-binding protein [Rhodospirillales bacterium]
MMRATLLFLAALAAAGGAAAEPHYSPGADDHEIKLGQTLPYSGPLSAYSVIGKAELAYFRMINEQGGINGRKITLISLDDGYSPPKTVEATRRLVEQEGVFAIVGTMGTSPNSAIQKYLNARKIPQVFIGSGASRWADPAHFPWTIGGLPTYRVEGGVYAKYILEHLPDARIGILYQDDDTGRDFLAGIHGVLGDKASRMIVKEAPFQVTDPTIDSQIVSLQGAGADVFIDIAPQKQAAQSIRKAYDIGWRPTTFLVSISSSVAAVLRPAGVEKAVGAISVQYIKDPTDETWRDDPGYLAWRDWMTKYNPDGQVEDYLNVSGYTTAQLVVQVLKQCGDELTRENFMRQVANLRHLSLPMLQPGIEINTSSTEYVVYRQLRLQKFDGTRWVRFGEIITE